MRMGSELRFVVPLKMWNELNDNYRKLQEKLSVFQGIQEGLAEVKRARKTGEELRN